MMLEFKNVSFRYAVDEFPMMENLSFSVEEGDFVSIIGASGCGKSTIFRLINGLEQLQKGEILVNGKPIREQKQYSAFMPQKDLLFPWRTIEKNICLPMELAGVHDFGLFQIISVPMGRQRHLPHFHRRKRSVLYHKNLLRQEYSTADPDR